MPVSRRRRGRAANRAVRSGNIPRNTRRKKTNKLYLVASLVIAVLVIASFAFASFSKGGGNKSDNTGYVQGVGLKQEIMPTRDHVPGPGQQGGPVTVDYNTIPPTSGNHWDTPQSCGFYEDGVPDERITHNLEHSDIVVSYNLPDQVDVDALKTAIDDIDVASIYGVTRSYDKIPEGQVVAAAWGVLDPMDGVDPASLKTFFDTYAGRTGPEGGIPCTGNQSPMNR